MMLVPFTVKTIVNLVSREKAHKYHTGFGGIAKVSPTSLSSATKSEAFERVTSGERLLVDGSDLDPCTSLRGSNRIDVRFRA